jgi:hypothetical protein
MGFGSNRAFANRFEVGSSWRKAEVFVGHDRPLSKPNPQDAGRRSVQ